MSGMSRYPLGGLVRNGTRRQTSRFEGSQGGTHRVDWCGRGLLPWDRCESARQGHRRTMGNARGTARLDGDAVVAASCKICANGAWLHVAALEAVQQPTSPPNEESWQRVGVTPSAALGSTSREPPVCPQDSVRPPRRWPNSDNVRRKFLIAGHLCGFGAHQLSRSVG